MQTQVAPQRFFPGPDLSSRYRVEVLSRVEVGDHGVSYLGGSRRETLQWASVLYALCAEVGEPEGVRTVVFDLVVERKGDECQVCRFDADPGSDAQETAFQIATFLGRGRSSRSLLALAHEGAPSRHLADLDALAEVGLAELGL